MVMKELSIEEKAKRYDEAFEIAKEIHNEHKAQCSDVMTKIFPELKESEDKEIREELMQYLWDLYHKDFYPPQPTIDTCDRWIAWIEKQEQHKKFRDSIQVGDKVTRNEDGVLVNLSQLERVAKTADVVGTEKQEWSEEDENVIEEIEEAIINYWHGDTKDILLNRLESLRTQSHWKPSDEQMHYLSWIANVKLGDSVVEQEVSKHLNELLEDLKKL